MEQDRVEQGREPVAEWAAEEFSLAKILLDRWARGKDAGRGGVAWADSQWGRAATAYARVAERHLRISRVFPATR